MNAPWCQPVPGPAAPAHLLDDPPLESPEPTCTACFTTPGGSIHAVPADRRLSASPSPPPARASAAPRADARKPPDRERPDLSHLRLPRREPPPRGAVHARPVPALTRPAR